MMRIFKYLLLLLLYFTSSHQKVQATEIYYQKLYKSQPLQLVKNFDMYLEEANSPEDRICLFYYTTVACQDYKLSDTANSYLKKLDGEMEDYKGDYTIKSIMYGKISLLYNNAGLIFMAKKMLRNAKFAADHIASGNSREEALSNYYFRSAHITSINKDSVNALKLYLLADGHFERIKRKNTDNIAYVGCAIAVNIADAYMDRKLYDKAIHYSKLAIKRDLNRSEAGVAYLNLGLIYSEKKQKDSALKYYKKSIKLLQDEGIKEYVNIAYDSIIEIYHIRGNVTMFNYYSKLQTNNLKLLEEREENVIELQEKPVPSHQITLIILFILVITCSIIGINFYLKNNRIRHASKINIEDIVVSEQKDENIDHQKIEPKKRTARISIKYEEYLIAKLQKFEKDLLFLETSMSLANLCFYLETNPKTLSEVINRYTGNNFNQYINKLRIDYICEKLRNDKKYRKYKISYIAKECGFLSHSTFTKIFKLNTGQAPSDYIDLLNTEEEI